MLTSRQLLKLLQISDSGYPVGGYAYSHGLESLFQRGEVTNAATVRDFAVVQLEETLARCDLPLIVQAHRAAMDHDVGILLDIDQLASALKPVPTFRESSLRAGRRLIEATLSSFGPLPVAAEFRDRMGDARVAGHHAVAFGIVTADLGIDEQSSASAFALSAIQGYVAAAVRLAIIGQSGAQQIISSLIEAIDRSVVDAMQTPLDDLGGYAPMIDLAGLSHRNVRGRLFAS